MPNKTFAKEQVAYLNGLLETKSLNYLSREEKEEQEDEKGKISTTDIKPSAKLDNDVKEKINKLSGLLSRTRKLGRKTKDDMVPIESIWKILVEGELWHDTFTEQNVCVYDNGDDVDSNMQLADAMEWLVVAQLSFETFGVVVQDLINEASVLIEEQEYWNHIVNRKRAVWYYFLQTLPSRVFNIVFYSGTKLSMAAVGMFKRIEDGPRISLNVSTPSLIVTSLFPTLLHAPTALGERLTRRKGTSGKYGRNSSKATTKSDDKGGYSFGPLFLLSTASPLHLTQQEAQHKQRTLDIAKQDLAVRIGMLAECCTNITRFETEKTRIMSKAASSSATDDDHDSIKDLASNVGQLLGVLVCALSRPYALTRVTNKTIELRRGSEATLVLGHLLKTYIPENRDKGKKVIEQNKRPSWLVRKWPSLVTLPTVAYISARTLKANQENIKGWFDMAKETVHGFFVGWVLEPVLKVLETVRHGEGGTLAIMGRESLESDFDSLERMVADFAKDQYNLGESEIEQIAQRAREGDLTSVLKAWEKDIKTPLKSAFTGNLIRTLLIQIQKMKVDVDLAMSGIEKMLQSQQLTFAFVGLAPSMIVVIGLIRWGKSVFISSDRIGKGKRQARNFAWRTMRRIDQIMTSTRDNGVEEQVLGLLLIETQGLRKYANSGAVPSMDREAFLDDVRSLEKATLPSVKIQIIERMYRSWSLKLGWQ